MYYGVWEINWCDDFLIFELSMRWQQLFDRGIDFGGEHACCSTTCLNFQPY